MPCQVAAPIRSGRSAPKYWATNVLTYPATPTGKQIIVQYSIPPASAAAKALDEYHSRNMRSTNIINDHVPVEMNSGSAMANTSRPPHGRDHQLSRLLGMQSLGGSESDELRRIIPETLPIGERPRVSWVGEAAIQAAFC